MKRRPSYLPAGWYPKTEAGVEGFLSQAGFKTELPAGKAIAAVSPHAGWTFSGSLAAKAVSSLREAETVVVVGGHLPRRAPILYAQENSFETPFGDLKADEGLLSSLFAELKAAGIGDTLPDGETDNSVEVLLPLVAFFKPGAQILWLRCPPNYMAKELGAALGRASLASGKKVACIGSTDLTHYGPMYGYAPAGIGKKAEAWVKGTNDKVIVQALLDMDCERALARALKDESACSSGAAVAALAFALEEGATKAELLGYATSLDVRDDASFVGYAAISYLKETQ